MCDTTVKVTLKADSTGAYPYFCYVTDADRKFCADADLEVIEYYLDSPCFENSYDIAKAIHVFQRVRHEEEECSLC